MRNLLESIAGAAVLLSPILVEASQKIFGALDMKKPPENIEDIFSLASLTTGASVRMPEILFPKIETRRVKGQKIEKTG